MQLPSSPPSVVAEVSAALQNYRLLVYRWDLQPDFLHARGYRCIRFGGYELEARVAEGAHMMRFQCNGSRVIEVVTPNGRHMPRTGRIHTTSCAGEQEHEALVDKRVNYISSVQTEVLPDSLYRCTLREMEDYVDQMEALSHRWRVPGRRYDSLSLVDFQWFKHEIHAQAWHLDATCGLILRSQAIFETLDTVSETG